MAGRSEKPSGLLSGQEMVKHHTESYEVQAQFNKLVSLEDFDESRQADLNHMKDQLRCLLSQERVNNTDSISEGVWENDHQRIRLTRVEGKWQSFGYEDSTGKYVESYEGLFLMEMNRLMVKWNGVVVSIEQGYSLLLGNPGSLTLEEYQVYSVLVRAGYYVLRYDPTRKYNTVVADDPSAEERYVWANLYEMLNQPNPRESSYQKQEKDLKLYEKVGRSMQRYCKLIRKAVAKVEESVDEPACKKQKSENELFGAENDSDGFRRIEQFRRMFERFDIVHSLNEEGRLLGTVEPAESNSLHLVFDLFATEAQTFKKSLPPLPIARIIVRRSSQRVLYFRELQRLYQQQSTPAPLLLMLVSDSLSVHCFLYDMRRIQRNVIALSDESSTRSASSSFSRKDTTMRDSVP